MYQRPCRNVRHPGKIEICEKYRGQWQSNSTDAGQTYRIGILVHRSAHEIVIAWIVLHGKRKCLEYFMKGGLWKLSLLKIVVLDRAAWRQCTLKRIIGFEGLREKPYIVNVA